MGLLFSLMATAVVAERIVDVPVDPAWPSVGPGSEGPRTGPALMRMALDDAGAPLAEAAAPNDPTAGSPLLVVQGFSGVDGTAKDGFFHTPPDTHMAAGAGSGAAGRVIMVTNSGLQIWNKSGASLAGPTPLGTFLGLGPTAPFDPKILYDQHSGRFFIVILQGNTPNPGGTSNVRIAVSSSGTPNNLTGDWTKLSGSALTSIGGFNTWFDYPNIGADSDSLFVTGNLFDSGGSFHGAKIRVFNKAALLAGSYSFVDINVDHAVTPCFTVQPAHVYGSTDNGRFYLINRIGSTSYRVMQITGDPSAPVLAVNATYSWSAGAPAPTGAPQAGTGIQIATLSSRIMNAVYRDGYIWVTLTSDPDGDGKSEAFWARIATNGGSPSVAASGYINGSDGVEWTFMPSINVNSSGLATICYTQSHSDQYPDMRYVSTSTGAPNTFGLSTVVAASPGYYDSFVATTPDRWGDYSACTVDPDDQNFWMANELVKTTALNASIWGTFIAKVAVSLASAPPVLFTIAYNDDTGFSSFPPSDYVWRGSFHVGTGAQALTGSDFFGNTVNNGWIAVSYRQDQLVSPPVVFTVAYNDDTGFRSYPPAGYAERGAFHLGRGVAALMGSDFYGNTLNNGWIAMSYRLDQLASPPVLFLIVYDDCTAAVRNLPAGYVLRGSIHLGRLCGVLIAGDFFDNRMDQGWLGMCYRQDFIPQGAQGAFALRIGSRPQWLRRISLPLEQTEGAEAIFKVYRCASDLTSMTLVACSDVVPIAAGDTICRSPEMNVPLEPATFYAIGMEWNGSVRVGHPYPMALAKEGDVVGRVTLDRARAAGRLLLDGLDLDSVYPIHLDLADMTPPTLLGK
jgi:hypothetical protein